uniref:Uncharacterized protein n=1 Tax=viral metagenome TaxID=1070528 RepID=A0A6C0LEB3_9ZZZZ
MTNSGICSRILTPKQVGPICWFMAAFVAMFYSQRSRRKLLNASKHWNTKKDLFTLLKQVLDDKYLKTASRESGDYKMFSDNTFAMILELLYKENNKAFPYNPKTTSGGFNSEYYIGKLYKLLNIDYKIFDYNVSDKHLFYSYLNDELNSMEYRIVRKNIRTLVNGNRNFHYVDENMTAPPVLLVIAHDNKEFTKFYKNIFPNTIINDGDTKKNITSLSENIYYRGAEYNLDSVILSNWNKRKTGHAIAGITCKKNKFVYNGWTRTSMDPQMANTGITRKIPCELMKYGWNIKKHNDFCLNTKTCIPDILKTKNEIKQADLCFNFSKGRRILVYIQKDVGVETSIEKDNDILRLSKTIHRPDTPNSPKKSKTKKAKGKVAVKGKDIVKKSPKKCEDGKVLNPATGRCILLKNAIAKGIIKGKGNDVVKKSPKKCEDGKVLNPATGRCILLKNAIVKGIIKGKGNDVVKKSPKKCEDGKVLNPATGRCILLKNAIAKGIAKAKGDVAVKSKDIVKKSPKKLVYKHQVTDKNAVQLSVFTYISKDLNFRTTAYYNEIIFVKLGNKVYIEIIEGDELEAPVNEMLDILMPYDELMKNKYLKKYYELSLMAIGKPNIDTNYYRENVNIQNNHHLIDTLYIVEDPLTKTKFAKKGNSYRHFNLAKLKKMTVADAYSIEEFNAEYNIRFGVDDKTFEDVIAKYTALANEL